MSMAARAEAPAGRVAPHSGRLLLRMPPTLHSELARRSEAAGASLNQFIVDALGAASRGEPGPRPLPRSVRIALVVNSLLAAVAVAAAIAALLLASH
jgi:hypothetical protein